MDDTKAFAIFQECTAQVLAVNPTQVTRDARFGEDLDADSLDVVEFVLAVEAAFDVTVDEEELMGIETIGQAFDLITSKL